MVEEGDFETLQRLEMQIWSHEDATAKMRQHDREAPVRVCVRGVCVRGACVCVGACVCGVCVTVCPCQMEE